MALKVEWHPYPEEKPIIEDDCIHYFWVTIKRDCGNFVQTVFWHDFGHEGVEGVLSYDECKGIGCDFAEYSSWDEDIVLVPNVIAWAYFEEPEPYKNSGD